MKDKHDDGMIVRLGANIDQSKYRWVKKSGGEEKGNLPDRESNPGLPRSFSFE
jgi:hypothetical protein